MQDVAISIQAKLKSISGSSHIYPLTFAGIEPELISLELLSDISSQNVCRHRLKLLVFMNYEILALSMATQLKFFEGYKRSQAIKTKHTAICQANSVLPPTSLERVFSSYRQGSC